MGPENSAPNKGLTKTQAVELVEECIRILQNCNLPSVPPSKDQLAILTVSGLRLLDGKIPAPTEDTPVFIRMPIDLLAEAAKHEPVLEGALKQLTADTGQWIESPRTVAIAVGNHPVGHA